MSKKQSKFPKRWLATFYNGAGVKFDSLEIDGFEWEANPIAEDLAKEKRADDWSLTPVKQ